MKDPFNLDDWLPDTFSSVERTPDERLKGLRLDQYRQSDVYGPILPLHLAAERFIRAYNEAQYRIRNSPQPTIVHPTVFAHWVKIGFITDDGEINPNWRG